MFCQIISIKRKEEYDCDSVVTFTRIKENLKISRNEIKA